MTIFYNEELRLLLEICILLLKANRKTINGKELDSISKNHFNIDKVSGRLCLLDETLGLKNSLATGTVSVRENGLEFDSITLKYPLWFYEKIMKEIDHNKFVSSMRESIWLPFYKESEAKKHLIENKFEYIGLKIKNKTISGIGDKSICLIDENGEEEFHWFILPKGILLSKKYKNTYGDGFDLAKEIIREHDFLNDKEHLEYIVYKEEILFEALKGD